MLLWRHWSPPFDFPLTFATLASLGVGGTDLQMLLHARHLAQSGCRVQVLGMSPTDAVDEGVDFVGATDRVSQERAIESGRVRVPAAVFLEGGNAAAPYFRKLWPRCGMVHVGQNIDHTGHRAAFALGDSIDVFGFVSVGHLADYSVRYPHMRHKFMLLRNVAPWDLIYRHVPAQRVSDRILWVGSWHKKGLRQWATVMARVLREFPAYTWTLCGPTYDKREWPLPPHVFRGLDIPANRIAVKSLPPAELAREISGSRVVLVSLGNETAGISALDAHAMGRPIISGNDVVYKFVNPEGTGLRVTSASESYRALSHLLRNPNLCDRMGALGHELALRQFTERHQGEDIDAVLDFLAMKVELNQVASYPGHSDRYDRVIDVRDKVLRKYNVLRARHGSR